MPTQQAYVGNNVSLFLGSGNDLSGEGNKCAFSVSQDVLDITTWGNNWRRVMTGLSRYTLKVEGVWKYGALSAEVVLFGLFGYLNQTVSYVLKWLRTTTGSPSYTGNAVLSNFDRSSDVRSPITWSATLEGDSYPTVGTVA